MVFEVGAARIPAHLVFEVLAYVVAFRLYVALRRRWGDAIPTGTRWSAIAGAAVGAAIGSKLVAWLERPGELVEHLTDPVYLMGGKSIVGGLLGGLAGVEIAKKIAGEVRSTGDLFVLPLCLGIAIGRIGCFLGGLDDHTYGNATRLPWGVDFGDGVRRHPTQIYEIAALGLIAWWAMRRHASVARSGDLFRGFMLLYLAFRLAVDSIKPDPRPYLGLTGIQVACVAGLLYYLRDLPRVFTPHGIPSHG
jgi:phosphatidylglycerol:prolipoprotein diacylglycerol transferase